MLLLLLLWLHSVLLVYSLRPYKVAHILSIL
uniref:Uncharacterized protein n=1 Tax=Arundo donax TaxID=35708 RepID=A0A0A9A1S6_ARUDO